MPKKRNAITDKQKAFALEYMRDSNATRAAIRAGYSEKAAGVTGHKLLKKAKVRAELKRLRKKLEVSVELTSSWVIEQLKANHEAAQKKKDIAASNKALELIGKHLGTFDEKGAEDPNVTIVVKTYLPGPPGSLVGKKKKR